MAQALTDEICIRGLLEYLLGFEH